jgi:hypothetical protein
MYDYDPWLVRRSWLKKIAQDRRRESKIKSTQSPSEREVDCGVQIDPRSVLKGDLSLVSGRPQVDSTN